MNDLSTPLRIAPKLNGPLVTSGPEIFTKYIPPQNHGNSKSGRFRRVFSRAAARRHFATSA